MNAHTYNAPTISAGTIARTSCLLLALTNQVLSALGKPVLPMLPEVSPDDVAVVEEQQLHPRSPSGRPDLRQAEGTGEVKETQT